MQTCQYCRTDNRDDAMYCNQCGAALGSAAGAGASAGPTPPRTSNATGRLPPQSQLRGRYLILQLVGQGGMAAVYRATSLKRNATVAIKEMSQDGLTPTELKESLESFRFEAVTLQRLRHPNLPRVYETFSENTRHYLVMDYIEGKTLEQHQQALGGGALPEAEVLRWAEQITSVLGYLHSQQPPIIFRDLKPSNIMLAVDGQIKLIDFGIARVFAPGRSRDTQVLGTPGFAPPEQYGKAQTDARADVYALGCTLYQLLTGYDPGSTPFNLPPLHTRNPSVSPALERALGRATKLSRDERYPSMQAFAADLRAAGATTTQARTQTRAGAGSSGTRAGASPAASGAARRGAGVGAAHVANPTAAAVVVVQPHTIDFGSLVAGQRGTQSFTISGQGNVRVQGQVKGLSPWLSLDRDRFSGTSTLVQLVAETSKLSKTGKQVSTLQIDCDRQHLYVPVTLNVLPAPAPATRVVPAVGAGTGRGAGAGRTQSAFKYGSASAAAAPSTGANRPVRLAMSVALSLGVVYGVVLLLEHLRTLNRFPVPVTLPVALGLLILAIILAGVAALIGSGWRRWSGRWQTSLFGGTAAAVLLIFWNGPYPWVGLGPIWKDPVTVPTPLLTLLPLAVGLGAAIGAEPGISRWMLSIVGLIGHFPRGFVGLAGAVGCGILCHNLAWQGAGSYAISCATAVGALIGGILAYRFAGAMRNVARSAARTRP
jgi:tRNA A-37 threonylcarbamoyl transferase component Bud32